MSIIIIIKVKKNVHLPKVFVLTLGKNIKQFSNPDPSPYVSERKSFPVFLSVSSPFFSFFLHK